MKKDISLFAYIIYDSSTFVLNTLTENHKPEIWVSWISTFSSWGHLKGLSPSIFKHTLNPHCFRIGCHCWSNSFPKNTPSLGHFHPHRILSKESESVYHPTRVDLWNQLGMMILPQKVAENKRQTKE